MNCPKCGNPLDPNMKFCAKCGSPAPQQPVQQRPAPQATAHSEPAPVKKAKKKGGKNNLAVKIVAIVLAVAVIVGGGVFAAIKFADKSKGKSDDAGKTDVATQNAQVGGTGIRVVSKVSDVDDNGNASSWTVYSYNDMGLVSKEEMYISGSLFISILNEYDENGNLIKTEVCDEVAGTVICDKYDEEGNLTVGSDSGYVEVEYDENHNLIKQTGYNADGMISYVKEYEYDSKNDIVKKAFYDYINGTVVKNTTTYVYDSNSRVIESTEVSEKNGNTYKYTYKYNANGDTVEKVKYIFSDGDNEYIADTRWSCEYDANNNITRTTIYEYHDDMIKYEDVYKYDANGYLTEKNEHKYKEDGTERRTNKSFEYIEISVESADEDKVIAGQKDIMDTYGPTIGYFVKM